jgi:predicted GH43/DUF377 family glycosyl hydrolase
MKNLTPWLSLAIVLALCSVQAAGQYTWTKDTRNPVLVGGNAGQWNAHIAQPSVLYNTDSSRYEMWFVGFSGAPGPNNDYHPYKIGYASSKDGISWTMYPSPVLSPTANTWDAYTTDGPMVIREKGQYKMWYTSYLSPTAPDYLGYATSPDGIHWTKYAGNPVMGPGKAAWEVAGPYCCSIIPVAGGYRMWYAGVDGTFVTDNIGYAASVDGIVWVKDTVNNPVLKVGATGQWDDATVGVPQVLLIGKTYYMWYLGWRSTSGPRAVGVAISNDSGKTWTKHPGNPVLVPSGAGWDGSWVEGGTVLQRGDSLDMWYAADVYPTSSNRWSIGHATAAVITGITEEENGIPQEFVLSQNYPNPFNPTTVIKYTVGGTRGQGPGTIKIRLVVYDLLGREVAVLVNEKKAPGHYEVTFSAKGGSASGGDASGLASGVYLYRLTAGQFIQTLKMLVVK